jgi:uncharacterized delta-60 repeat protein
VLATSVASAKVHEMWVARYNGPGDDQDGAWALTVDADGNIYVTGQSYGSGTYSDYATVKYDPNGDTVWVARYNSPWNSGDIANAVAVDAAGNVYVTGDSYVSTGYTDYATVKYDPDGNQLWVARYDGTAEYFDRATALAVDDSGNVYVTGSTGIDSYRYDYATIKYGPNGDTLWLRLYGGSGYDWARALAVDDSGNVYVTGEYKVGSYYDYATIKYDSNGDTLWVRRYNGPGGYNDRASALAMDDSGNVYVTGGSTGSGLTYDYGTIKYDPNGDTAWVRHYDGPARGYDEASALALDGSGNVYVTGYSEGSGTDFDYATIKYDSDGNELWVARYNGPQDWWDQANALAVDDFGNVYVTGTSWNDEYQESSDYATVKYNANGDSVWAIRYTGPLGYYNDAADLALDDLRNVYVTGMSGDINWNFDYTTIKYSQPDMWMSCDVSPWPVCRGRDVTFSVTYANESGSPVNIRAVFSGYSGYDCDPSNHLIAISRNRTIPTGITTYYYYFKVPNSVQPGEYSISVGHEYGGNPYTCCMNVDVIECSPWKTGANTEWELVEVDRPESEVSMPTVTELHNNCPNPFNAGTRFSYSLVEAGRVKLTIHNLRGQLVETVVDGRQEAGEHQVIWDASDFSSGVYFYRLQAGDFVSTKKMNLLR